VAPYFFGAIYDGVLNGLSDGYRGKNMGLYLFFFFGLVRGKNIPSAMFLFMKGKRGI
jgi:hypothetical protein